MFIHKYRVLALIWKIKSKMGRQREETSEDKYDQSTMVDDYSRSVDCSISAHAQNIALK